MTVRYDVAIVGAGMAGASLAAEIAGRRSVVLIEAEEQPGYHATGRSAAFWAESYGGPAVQPLTSASGPYLRRLGLLRPRGALHIARADGGPALAAMAAEFSGDIALAALGREALQARIPGLRPGWDQALFEPSCADIDVGGLHAAYLAAARRGGARVLAAARLVSAERGPGGGWHLQTAGGEVKAGILVNAAGAWADKVAARAGVAPLGIRPFRRTMVQLRVEPGAPAELPLVIDALGGFYFKPEAGGRIWLSPHDEVASEPCDSAPDEYDIALAIDRFEQVVDWRVEGVERSWAGLRSFAPDRVPVYGFAADRADFFWFAGQGGFGIQTAPAAAKLAAASLLGIAPDPMVAEIDPAPYRPHRLDGAAAPVDRDQRATRTSST